jgi:nucleoid-associated protein YgaU
LDCRSRTSTRRETSCSSAGVVPTDYAQNEVWDAIKQITLLRGSADIVADVNVQSATVYKVLAGDTLSKIAKTVLRGRQPGANRIFEANRDQLSDPDKIRVGQELGSSPDLARSCSRPEVTAR